MKNIFQFFAAIMMCVFLMTSCKKAELIKYQLPDMVYFYKASGLTNNDSTTYSFAIKDKTLLTDTVFLPMQIMGGAKDYEREIKLVAVDSLTTAVAGTDYVLIKTVIPAGAFNANVPMIVKRDPVIKTIEKRLVLEVQQSKDFLPGVPSTSVTSISNAGGTTRYLVKINDYLTKPNNWDTYLKIFFGAYSQVKYGFIIQATGRALFPLGVPGGLSYDQMSYYRQVCRNALAEYVAQNGPLIDEFENPVTF